MTIDVLAPSYDSAAEALIAVNHDAAILYIDLKGELNACGSMAGDDSTSTEFSASYDENAQAAVDALCDLVDAAGNLGVLTATSIANHRQADAAAVYTAPPLIFDGCYVSAGTGELDVERFDVPASEGGDGGDMPEFLDIIIDHVQGVVWPNADTAKLRVAGAAWRTAAGALDLLDAGCQSAIDLLSAQRSPEIPLALAAIRDLKASASDLADACRSLGSACDDYAQEVDDRRDEIKGILKSLAIEAGLTMGAGVVLSVFTAGLAGAAATTAVVARATSYGARIISVLHKLKTAVRAGALLKLGSAGTKVKGVGPVLKRLKNRTRRGGHGAAARTSLLPPRGGGWARPQTLARHFRDHGADFGARNADDYATRASEFYTRVRTAGLPTKVADDGTIRAYDAASNTFASFTKDGMVKTFFKPTSPSYWDRQPGVLQ